MMMDDPPFEPDRALVERWRAAVDAAAPPPDAMILAAYAEGRLDDAAAEQVEAALAADPELLDTLLALRAPAETALPSPALIRSTQALVAADPVVVPFIRRAAPARGLNAWLAWGAVAASLLLVSLAGFDLGMQTGHAVDTVSVSDDSPSDLLDLSSFTGDDIG
jgi:anti-sigma factor RsiW